MSAAPAAVPGLAAEVIAHLDEQIASGRRLLASILAQGASIRSRDVEGVVSRLGEIKTEMDLRGRLEEERAVLLGRAGTALGVPAAAVTLDGLATLMTSSEAAEARVRSAELRGLLDEIAREHGTNRALMRQELAFLDHLVRLMGSEAEAGYNPAGPTPPSSNGPRALDLQA
jgi:hypothetical protein